MVEFNLWIESFIFIFVFALVILIPCFFVGLLGRKLIRELSYYPTKAPRIHMKYLLPIVAIEIVAFLGLMGFYNFFMGSFK